MSVQSVVTRATGKDISELLNAAGEQYGFDPAGLLAGAIAESNIDDLSKRERAWPDVSYGLFHPAVKWIGPEANPLERLADGTAADTLDNRERVRQLSWDPVWSIDYVAPRYAKLLNQWGEPLEAWCRWNKPSIPGTQNPNRANYERALARAEEYRVMAAIVGEGIANKMREAGDTAMTHEWEEIHGLSVQKKARGLKGLYVASQDTGDWITVGPLVEAE